MSTTILQQSVARCRQDFTTTSNTAVLISGTQRRLTVTAGSYLELDGVASCSLGAAADVCDQAVGLKDGGTEARAGGLDYDNLQRQLTLNGPVRATVAPPGRPRPPASAAPARSP